jgi:hypothetical protein
MPLRRLGEMQIDEDPKFTRRLWKVERVGWAFLAAFVAAGLLGLAGAGPISDRTAESPDGRLRVEYERFGHQLSDSRLRVHLRLPPESRGMGLLWLGREYLDALKVETLSPEPAAVRAESDRTTYAFLAGEGDGTLTVTFDFTFRRAGRIRGRVGSADASPVEFRHFVYP